VTAPGTVRAATWALRAQFFVAGALFATLGVHVPSIKAHYGLGEQALAIALLASGAGSVVTLLQAGACWPATRRAAWCRGWRCWAPAPSAPCWRLRPMGCCWR
jgi:hypothetical protein